MACSRSRSGGTSATIGNLTEDTVYQVQVRARGDGRGRGRRAGQAHGPGQPASGRGWRAGSCSRAASGTSRSASCRSSRSPSTTAFRSRRRRPTGTPFLRRIPAIHCPRVLPRPVGQLAPPREPDRGLLPVVLGSSTVRSRWSPVRPLRRPHRGVARRSHGLAALRARPVPTRGVLLVAIDDLVRLLDAAHDAVAGRPLQHPLVGALLLVGA